MTEAEARRILSDFGIEDDDSIGTRSETSIIKWPYWEIPDEVGIFGVLSPDVLEALVWWMKHKHILCR